VLEKRGLENFARAALAVLRHADDGRSVRAAKKDGVSANVKKHAFAADELATMAENVDRCGTGSG
jgi:hypothetical protein